MELAARRLSEIIDDPAFVGAILYLCPESKRSRYVSECARLMPKDAVDKLSSFSLALGDHKIIEAITEGMKMRAA